MQGIFFNSHFKMCLQSYSIVSYRGEKVQPRVHRIFKIWEERDIYSNSFVQELSMLLETPQNPEQKSSVKLSSDFEVNDSC